MPDMGSAQQKSPHLKEQRMSKRTPQDQNDAEAFDSAGAHITNIPLQDEISRSFLEYSYSVITSRALPDAADGLKPVHRRILFSMIESGLRPDHVHVKSARIVGDCMGKFHPHGDTAIYDAMVRMSQDFALNTPLVDGHGNFGSPNDGPAAMRYTESRLAPAAMLLVSELDEGTVDFIPNYDGSMTEPAVLPAQFPNLLVNGSTGIAVGMATNMIPHNMGEVIAATRLLIANPDATLNELMALVPGPDLPGGGLLLGLDEVRKAYTEGRGSVRIRAKTLVEPLEGSRGRMSIVATELPYGSGTERIIEKIKDEISKKRLQGIADVKDLSDRRNGVRLVIECKTGVNPQTLINELYRYTPLEVSFGIANLALVQGQPKILGLKELLEVFLEHRYTVVTRRTQFRLNKAQARQHIVDGLLIALDAIDEVVKTIRASEDTGEARTALMAKFGLSDIQTGHILDMPLRRLVSLEMESLRRELAELLTAIAELEAILADRAVLRALVDTELADVAERHPTPRRTTLLDGDIKEVLAAAAAEAAPIQIADTPCLVVLSATGLLARTEISNEEAPPARAKSGRAKHDAITSVVSTTLRSRVLALTSTGRAVKVDVLALPAVPFVTGALSLRGGMSAVEAVALRAGERIVGIAALEAPGSAGIAIGTRNGIVKVASYDWPLRSDQFDVIGLKDGDEVVAAHALTDGTEELVFVSSDSSLLRFPALGVRAQGRSGSGMAGIKLADGARAIAFAAVRIDAQSPDGPMVVTFTGASGKVTPLSAYPAKGRATGGVRSQRFLRDELELKLAWVGSNPVAATLAGEPLNLPAVDQRRDASGGQVPNIGVVGECVNV
jgi:DNA gyrase subunit A